MSEWQPIESAPKDGRPLLLCGGQHDNESYVEGFDGFFRAPCTAFWLDSHGWVTAFAEAGYVVTVYNNPTHWCHCPPPPAEEAP